ncbi:MAG: AEC family transporter [Nitrospirae bacterium]|nr:AEC family transporter [Nitrospirota bacterium]
MQKVLLELGLIIFAGFLFKQVMPAEVNIVSLKKAINALVFNIFLPALCVIVVYRAKIDTDTLLLSPSALLTLAFTLALSFAIYTLLGKRFNISPKEKGTLILASIFGNNLYLGLPVITCLYGQEAGKYVLFYAFFGSTLFLWTVGVAVASHYGRSEPFRVSKSIKTILTLSPIWGLAVGMMLNLSNASMPAFFIRPLEMLSSLVVPLMTFSIGLSVSMPKQRHTVSIAPAVIIKLLIMPFISLVVARSLGLNGVALSSCLIEGAMPTMVLSLLIASRFCLDVELAALSIVVTTVSAFITLPLVMHVAEKIITTWGVI